MTRIVSGFAGSLSLAVPRSGTRPTSDRVREAIFSSLEAMDAVQGMNVLDLYAGSGALALEAVSRGAASAVLVEQNGQAAGVCKANSAAVLKASERARTGIRPRVDVRQTSVRSYLAQPARPSFDLVFLDPPYDVSDEELSGVLSALVPRLREDALVVVERSARSPEPHWPDALELVRTKSYGETAVWFAQPAAPSQPE
ncbi:16S rRNA (guanine(966)-N(2))-methyltransferase RsmD [Humibacter sp.]|uniref:16S rRNA (guanine(966)-N(2))-methyltransferase RsmD n=1 Tax=Humibacter sp. TaxID=1940291 RepID=UPI003F7D5672